MVRLKAPCFLAHCDEDPLNYWHDVSSVVHPRLDFGNCLMGFAKILQNGSRGQYPKKYFGFLIESFLDF